MENCKRKVASEFFNTIGRKRTFDYGRAAVGGEWQLWAESGHGPGTLQGFLNPLTLGGSLDGDGMSRDVKSRHNHIQRRIRPL